MTATLGERTAKGLAGFSPWCFCDKGHDCGASDGHTEPEERCGRQQAFASKLCAPCREAAK